MHEIGYCEALLPAVARRAGDREVRRVGIRAGVAHRLLPDVVQMAWQQVAADTPFASAETVLNETPLHATCTLCGHEFDTTDTLADCPSCGGMGSRFTGGDEFALEWLEFADGYDHEHTDESVTAPPYDGHDHEH